MSDHEQRTFWRNIGSKTYIQFTCEHCIERVLITQPRSYSMLPTDTFCPKCGAQTGIYAPFLYHDSFDIDEDKKDERS